MATKAQETVPNLVKEGKLDEIFDKTAREKEHRDFVAGAKANPGVARSVEEIERLHVEAETPPKEAAAEAVHGLTAPIQKRPKTTMPGKRKDEPAGVGADVGDETVVDSRPPRTAEQDAWARHWMIRGVAIGLAIVLLAAFAIAFYVRSTSSEGKPTAGPTGAAVTGAATSTTAATSEPSARATATAIVSAGPTETVVTPTATATATVATAATSTAKKSAEPTSPVKTSVEPPPPATIPPLVTTPTTAVPPPPSTSGKKPIFP